MDAANCDLKSRCIAKATVMDFQSSCFLEDTIPDALSYPVTGKLAHVPSKCKLLCFVAVGELSRFGYLATRNKLMYIASY